MIEEPIIPEVCDRIHCFNPECYGRSLCSKITDIITYEETVKLLKGLHPEWFKENKQDD